MTLREITHNTNKKEINHGFIFNKQIATDTTNIKDKMTTLYNDLLEDLKEEGKTKIIERLIQTENDLRTSYEVKTVPIP